MAGRHRMAAPKLWRAHIHQLPLMLRCPLCTGPRGVQRRPGTQGNVGSRGGPRQRPSTNENHHQRVGRAPSEEGEGQMGSQESGLAGLPGRLRGCPDQGGAVSSGGRHSPDRSHPERGQAPYPEGRSPESQPWALHLDQQEAIRQCQIARREIRPNDPGSCARWIEGKQRAAEVEERVSKKQFRKFVGSTLNRRASQANVSKILQKWE